MPTVDQDRDVQAACKALAVIDSPAQVELRAGGERVELSEGVLNHLATLLNLLASGKQVRIEAELEELSTQQAAERLGVSRTHLIELLEEGVLPHRKVGTHRRVRTEDILTYKEASYRRSQAILKELTEEAQALGFYD